ncbi:MAG: hypothetical protein NTX63_02710 [Candidatus Peregrinibacteria bacterium]|nr:hypothetical protein [Candidatus Peregrinibacteria bacterium]
MAKAATGSATYKNASFIYFWLGLLTGALIIIMTIILQSAVNNGQASIFSGYSVRGITNPQTVNGITNPQTRNGITNPQTKTGITNPQTLNGITNPQTMGQ